MRASFFLCCPAVVLALPGSGLCAPAVPSYSKLHKEPPTTLIFGRTILDGYEPALTSDTYLYSVTVQYEGEKTRQPDRPSSGELFCYRVTLGRKLQTFFETTGYASQYGPLTKVQIAYGQAAHPDVRLSPQPSDTSLAPAELRHKLDAEAEAADSTQEYDLFQWNLAVLETNFKANAGLENVIMAYEQEKQNQAYMAPQYSARRKLYASIIARNRGTDVVIDASSLIRLADGAGALHDIFPAIRAQAIQAMAEEPLAPDEKTAFLKYLRTQSDDSVSLLFRVSRTALAKMGDDSDQQRIIAELGSMDPERILASIIAVGKARLASGRGALRSLAGGSNPDPEITSAAKTILRRWDIEQPLPLASLTSVVDIWNSGTQNSAFQMQALTGSGQKMGVRQVNDGAEDVLEVDYPGDSLFGLLQFYIPQAVQSPNTVDYSRYTDLVVVMRSETPGLSVKVGIKGASDPQDTILFEPAVTNIGSDWNAYPISLIAGADDNQPKRLQSLTVPVQISFSGRQPQRLYIRRIYFAGP